jgi:hypothetical protein
VNEIRHRGSQLGRREVLVAAVDCFELAAVDGDEAVREQAHAAAEQNETPAGRMDRHTVVASEVSSRLEVGREMAE